MKILRMKRGEGKTYQLLKVSEETQIPIVVPTQKLKHSLMEKAAVYGFNRVPTPFSFDDGPLPEKILIDDAEYTLPLLVEYFLGTKIEYEAISTES